jgi:tetrahydromethanopterin S-methyltransferase subunit F
VVIGAAALMGATAAAFAGTRGLGHFTDAAGLASGLQAYAGRAAGVLFAIALLDASIIGAFAVSLSTAYAVSDVFGINHSLHHGVKSAKGFYGIYAGLIGIAAAVVLIPGSPLGLLTRGRTGPGGRAAAQRERVPAAAVQQQGRSRPLGQRRQDQPVHRRRRGHPGHPVGHLDRIGSCSRRSPPARSWGS